MYPKFKSTLSGLMAAMSFVMLGYAFGQPLPADHAATVAPPQMVAAANFEPASDAEPASARDSAGARRGLGLKRHLTLPYISFAPLLPRRGV